MLPLISRSHQFTDRTAIIDPQGSYTYGQLLADSAGIARNLLEENSSLKEARVAFMIRPGYDYVKTQWAIWRAGGIAVPIGISYPEPSIRYLLEDSQVGTIVAAEEFRSLLGPIAAEMEIPMLHQEGNATADTPLPDVSEEGRAMILYTSGTTGKPKGVVSTHASIEAQITALTEAWEWQQGDHILNILPLHHVHGIINVLSCALWSGACCQFLPAFDAQTVFAEFLKGRINLFMAVPTIYYKLISHWEKLPEAEQAAISSRLKQFRLMVSGSAALPVSTLEKWRSISGHTLLERYGMTEMGMAISNPYQNERRPGHIGQPLPGVKVRLMDKAGNQVPNGEPGEIQVKGANVFREYWNKPEATAGSFTEDGWFMTGDIAQLEDGYYRILGRNSVDIIKSGGYKISALEIEEVLRKHPAISDCGVVGIPDEEWGEIVGAGLVLGDGSLDYDELKDWLKQSLPGYKIPRKYLLLDELPRNAMGKVTKKELTRMFTSNSDQA